MTRRRGLTLVELLVALTVTAVTVGAGGAALGGIVDARDRAATRAAGDATARAASVRRQLMDWIEGAHIGDEEAPAFRVTDHARAGRADDELSFLTSALTPIGRGEVVVRLFIDRDARTPETGLVAELSARRTARVERVVLDPTVDALDVRCFSESRGQAEWLTSWLSATLLPRGVELRLGAPATARLAPLLRVPMTVAIEGGR